MSNISPAIKTTSILALIYAAGLIALWLFFKSNVGCTGGDCGFARLLLFNAWMYIFPAIALIIIIGVLVMETIDAKRQKNNLQK
ncbi:MAG: hypothetical protein P4L74_01300 [Candidatus Doudnabacteria bacterium]|nr:hypothetical protein [Candidatus Doudnabacteria bacterium]